MSPRYILVVLALAACSESSPTEPAVSDHVAALLGPENIDPGNVDAQYAWSENAGWGNAEPKPPDASLPGLFVSHGSVTGYMWLENLGWLSLSCENTGSCGTSSYGVVNDGDGNLSGMAWGENIGWVDFQPSIGGVPVPGAGVVIDPASGIFDGYAWGENIGWLSFTLSPATAASQIETSWRPCTPLDCDDGNSCTTDSCEPVGCSHVPVVDGTSCANGDLCDGSETCQAGTCSAGPPLDCDDGDACTADSCDAVLGCEHAPITCPAACVYDPATATITVTMSGVEDTLSISSGNILLGGATCGTLTTTDSIVVNGTGGLTIVGDFVPGQTAEGGGTSEIEFTINNDIITFDMVAGADTVNIGTTGADLYGDGDQDVAFSGSQSSITFKGGPGNDTLDASAATGPISLFGSAGADHLIGGAGADTIFGGADSDTIDGGGGPDQLYGGAGNDIELGGNGADVFHSDATADGADVIDGGVGADELEYRLRTAAVTVTLGDGIANDGEPGENDAPTAIERATGGDGADILTGSSATNILRGGNGNDTLRGGDGVDTLYGDAGDDNLDGEAGGDTMYGGLGNDTLVGDAVGIDGFVCQGGNDTVIGNTDGNAESVNCGGGVDTAQGNGEDVFKGCENLPP